MTAFYKQQYLKQNMFCVAKNHPALTGTPPHEGNVMGCRRLKFPSYGGVDAEAGHIYGKLKYAIIKFMHKLNQKGDLK